MSFDVKKIREDFPILQQKIYDKPLVYFDNGATTQKPQCVIDVINEFHYRTNSSIHRGVHFLSEQATEAYENARKTVQQYIHAQNSDEIVFTSGSTGSINGLAFSLGELLIKEKDEIIISEMEHHANIVPWQMLCERKNAVLKVIPITDSGELILEEYKNLISDRTKIISITHISNVLGTVNPIMEIIEIAHQHNIPVIIDAAQSIQHTQIDVQKLDCDFLVFSGHKAYGPTGIGIIYGKEIWLEKMPPFQGGGDMIDTVTFEKTTYNKIPFKFEAGTTNYIAAIGMAKAFEYLSSIGLDKIHTQEKSLLDYITKKLDAIGNIKIFGNVQEKSSILSFLINGIHQYDAGMVIDKFGVAVRTGTHCAQPLMQRFGVDGTIRASLCFYNTTEEIDILIEAIQKVKQMFK